MLDGQTKTDTGLWETRGVSLRGATDADGPTIGNLVALNNYNISDQPIDWTRVYPYWVVAEYDGEIVAALQVCMGKPIGRLEMLTIDPELSPQLRGGVFKDIVHYGMHVLKRGGAQFASFMVPFELKSYSRVLKKRGCVKLFQGNTMIRRL